MSTFTERLLQTAAIITILYFGWQIAAQTVVDLMVTKANLRACQQELVRGKLPAVSPPELRRP